MTSKTIDGYTYSLSTNKNKKLKVVVDGKTIHFGDTRYEHFFDKTEDRKSTRLNSSHAIL